MSLFKNAGYWREGLTSLGFDLLPGEHPIIPVMLGEARLAQGMAAALYDEGVYVAGFFYPVVPHGRARIRRERQRGSSHRGTGALGHADRGRPGRARRQDG